jgi:hypothetical protein
MNRKVLHLALDLRSSSTLCNRAFLGPRRWLYRTYEEFKDNELFPAERFCKFCMKVTQDPLFKLNQANL